MLEPKKWLLRIDNPSDSEITITQFSVGYDRGPRIFVGDSLSRYNKFLPDNRIMQIKYEPYAVDPSGYEYFGTIIFTD